MNKSEKEWKKELTDEQYRILRKKGTEMPHSGAYNLHFEKGTYCCAGCNEPLFESSTKFDAHCGWPSFDESIKGKVGYVSDKTLGMIRTEIVCQNCNGHLGHVFNDGPTQTGTRYCVNSVSLEFEENK
jgi:peptide-methionine (R)-S-oxide reductase